MTDLGGSLCGGGKARSSPTSAESVVMMKGKERKEGGPPRIKSVRIRRERKNPDMYYRYLE